MVFMAKGILFVLSGPSGAGKGTALKKVFKKLDNLEYSVSATTRKPRKGEIEGKNYFFKTDEEFNSMLQNGELLEHVEKYGNRYGTVKSFIEEALNKGKDVILEIETVGAEKIKNMDFEQVRIFLTPSSIADLIYRLSARNTETEDWRAERLRLGKEELKCAYDYDYIVVNDDLHKAVEELVAIITAERCRVKRNLQKIKNILQE
ncbi:MAG TPA: guanylate kinase [Clostridiales bacterium]|nr:guanylate kinase [Clostridiales bacterium]